MKKIILVAETGSDISKELAAEYGIYIVPMHVNFDDEIIKDLLPEWFYDKYMKNRNFDNYETGREKAIIFGIPVSMIKGIMVSRKIEQESSNINKIKELFPNCYICNIDGKVIS